MIYEFQGIRPVVHPSAFVHPQANVTGNVLIGPDCYIGPFCALRGDWGQIVLHAGVNVQESCTVHMFPGRQTILRAGTHVGHGAVVHGADVGENVLIGMNAVLMDEVLIEEECIIGALSFVKARMHVPRRSLLVGNPGKVIKPVSDTMLRWKTEGTKIYQHLPQQLHDTLRECEPLREVPAERGVQAGAYAPWKVFGQSRPK